MTTSFFTQIGSDIDGVAGYESNNLVSLSADGSTVAIGVQGDLGSGQVKIFKNVNDTWTQVGSDINGETNTSSGWSVSLSADGSIVAIGNQSSIGVKIYKNINNTWTQLGSNINGNSSGDNFGESVSLSANGNIVAIGATQDYTGNGYVRIYQNVNDTWIKVGADINGESFGDQSGGYVSLSDNGNIVAIGAEWNDNDNGNDSGHVRIYQNVNNSWIQIGGDIDGADGFDLSGNSISLSSDGSVVAIGAWNKSSNGPYKGHVRIYRNVSNSWVQIGGDIDGEADRDHSGHSVSLSADGNLIAIGAKYNRDNGIESGHVRIYKNVNDTWTQFGGDIDGEAAYDRSGTAVSLSADGSTVAISAPDNDGNGIGYGHVRVYKINNVDPNNSDTTPPDSPSLTNYVIRTNDSTPTITGTAEASSTVKLYNGSILLGSTKADTNGAFSITSSALNDATYSLTLTVTDNAGNTSSGGLSIEVNQNLITDDTDNVEENENLITGDFEWAKLYGSSAGEEANAGISIDNEGNIFFTGATQGNLNGEIHNGNQDIFLLKLDSNGNEIWTKLYGSFDNEIPYGISFDNANNIFITGTATGNLNGQINKGDMDAFVMKLDSNGNEIWTKLFGTELSDIAWGGTFDENIYLWGETHGNLNGEVNNDLGNEDAFLIKLDSNGNEIWTTLIGTELHEEAWDIAVANDDSVYLVGETQDSKVPNNDSTDDILVSKIDQLGNLVWSKSFGEFQKEDRATSIDIGAEGNLYVSGFTESNLNGQLVNGSSGSFLMKLDKNGNEIWTKLYGTANRENAFDMDMRSDGYIYLTGMSDPNDKGFLKKIDLDGNEIWTKFFGSANWDFYRNLHLDDNGSSIYISGETRGGLANNVSNGETDAILYEFSDPFILSESLALNYIASNPDLIAAFVIDTSLAKSHYLNYGISEGRSLTSFSATNYLAKYSDLSAAFGSDQTLALKHYIEYGFSEGRTDTSSSSGSGSGSGSSSGVSSNLTDLEAYNYIASNNDLISAFGVDIEAAKTHYTNYGISEGRSLDSFSASNYLAKYSDLSAAFGSDQTLALKHYIEYGFNEGRTDSSTDSGSSSSSSSGSSSNLSDFQALNYIASYGDLINAFGTDLTSAKSHYTNYGKSEGRTLDDFNEWGYLASNNDLINSFGSDTTEAIKHYISFGYSQGKITNSFDAQSYLNNYADLRNAFGTNEELATKHYVEYGFHEGRIV